MQRDFFSGSPSGTGGTGQALGVPDPAQPSEPAMACAWVDGELWRVQDLPVEWSARSPQRPDMRCVFCAERVFPRGGIFVHAQGAQGRACQAARVQKIPRPAESAWHAGAKRLLEEASHMMIPPVYAAGVLLSPARWVAVRCLRLEARVANLRVDALMAMGVQLFGVEITVTHGLTEQKRAQASQARLALLEINLSDWHAQPWDDALGRAMVLDGVARKHWHLPEVLVGSPTQESFSSSCDGNENPI